MNTRLLFTAFFIFHASTFIYSQVEYTKTQLSLDASKFSQIFSEQGDNTLDLNFRIAAVDSSHTLRLATSFGFSSDDDEFSNFAFRIGMDNVYKESRNWKFYSGVDIEYAILSVNDSDRSTSRIGLIPFLGFLYHIGPHFSISTEPSIGIYRETENFFNRDSESEYRFSLVNLGQVRLGFHF